MTSKDGISPSFVETVAGFTAGIVSTLCLHPLDLIKTRLQVDRSSTNRIGSSLRVIRLISQNEGGISAFYRGLTPNLLGNSTSWALYFLCYSNLKSTLSSLKPPNHPLSSTDYFLASGTAGLTTSLLTNPIWVIKTRMLSTGSGSPGAYASFTRGAMQILQNEGVPGFYRGLVPALFGVSHGALQFMAYENLKVYHSTQSGPLSLFAWSSSSKTESEPNSPSASTRKLGNIDFFILSSLSKIFAGCVTYPYQVLRARLQAYDAHLVYRGSWDAIMQIWVKEGLSGFYKGLGPNIFRVLPSTWVTFLVYENTRLVLNGL